MRYYKVYLPLKLKKDFSYASDGELPYGARVLVPLKGKLIMGIVADEVEKENFRYKKVAELLDTESVLPIELMELAKWMAEYYLCSMGKALFAMLPANLQADIDAKVSWIKHKEPDDPRFLILKQAIGEDESISLSQLRKKLPNHPIYKLCEEAEALGLITLNSKIRYKDKPKVKNFIRRIDFSFDENSLPLKQREAFELIKAYDEPFPMADISSYVAYSSLKALVKKGIIEIFPREVKEPQLFKETGGKARNVVLNEEQKQAVAELEEDFGHFQVHLLYGITGSGKTEVYIRLIRRYLSIGKSVIFLIPEIALTPQMLDRFDHSFGDSLAVLHSKLTDNQRFAQWQRIKEGKCRLIVGARSAIFAPAVNLGLIIVDEEHEQSYKQDSSPRYQGRDLAIVRAKMQNAQVILGSATPSLESWQNAQTGKYKLHELKSRPLNYQLPEVRIVDLYEEEKQDLFSHQLLEAIKLRLQKKEQVILFQNRRGFSSFVQCMKCGHLITCQNCEISMYYHRDRQDMQCHYCGNSYPIPRRCPKCGSFSFSYGSPGTQKVEQSLKVLFPTAKILRLDSDSPGSSLESMYRRMKNLEIDILLGTQMITKGLDFPNVTLVGIINADISLNVPDFRAAERSFQLITQVAGRSGRADKEGEVIIQSYNPNHYAITSAKEQNFPQFASIELKNRKALWYPPHSRLARILFLSTDIELLKAEMKRLLKLLPKNRQGLLILGPVQAPMSLINRQYRWHVILKGESPKVLKDAIYFIEDKFDSSLHYQIDIDPTSLL